MSAKKLKKTNENMGQEREGLLDKTTIVQGTDCRRLDWTWRNSGGRWRGISAWIVTRHGWILVVGVLSGTPSSRRPFSSSYVARSPQEKVVTLLGLGQFGAFCLIPSFGQSAGLMVRVGWESVLDPSVFPVGLEGGSVEEGNGASVVDIFGDLGPELVSVVVPETQDVPPG